MIRAFLLAKATVAMFVLRRHFTSLIQILRGSVFFALALRTDRAPWISKVRKYVSPRLLMLPRRSLPPLEC